MITPDWGRGEFRRRAPQLDDAAVTTAIRGYIGGAFPA